MHYQIFPGLFMFMLFTDIVELGRRNVAIHKTVTSSSIFQNKNWNNLSNIVDGNLDQGGDNCGCCAATESSNNPWITVDLEKEYFIDEVLLYGRTDASYDNQNFVGLELYLTQSCQINENSTYAYKVGGSRFIDLVNKSFEEQALTRYLTLYMPKNSKILSMCEVEIYSMVCDDGLYGSNCSGVCGNCFNGEPCDKVDGTCEVCSPGYQGRLCDTECRPGTFGQNCSEQCGICSNYSRCDHLTGICLHGCAAGRRGNFCIQECETNTFGENCSLTCHCQDGNSCNAFTGSCENGACADGFSGVGCQQAPFEKQQEESGFSLTVFIGVTVVLICIIVGLVAIVLLMKYRNSQKITQPAKSKRIQSR